ncbi:MAG: hypothetical protein KF810_13540 [Rhizobiaceae bacterium]|nr:hypothetical protein [Rhizobiaceae bacterium]
MKDPDDDSIGYGRPPRHHQWKKGQSGNPTGSKRAGLFDHVREIFAEEMPETAGLKKPNVRSLMYFRLCIEGIKGKNASLFKAIDLAIDHEAQARVRREPRYLDMAAIRRELARKLGTKERTGDGATAPVNRRSAKERRAEDRSIEKEVNRIMRDRKKAKQAKS